MSVASGNCPLAACQPVTATATLGEARYEGIESGSRRTPNICGSVNAFTDDLRVVMARPEPAARALAATCEPVRPACAERRSR